MHILKKVDWAAVGQIALVSGVVFGLIRAAEAAYPVVRKATVDLPNAAVGTVKRVTG